MMTFGIASSLILAAVMFPLVSPQKMGGNCFDGPVCNCQMYLSDQDFSVLQRRVNCFNQVGAQHPFSKGSGNQITQELCTTYVREELQGEDLTKCVYKDIGLIKNINGTEQWDVNSLRIFGIDYWIDALQAQQDPVLRTIIITTFIVCHADPLDFSKIPLDDCWQRAVEIINSYLGQANSKSGDLSNADRNNASFVDKSDFVVSTMLCEPDRLILKPVDLSSSWSN